MANDPFKYSIPAIRNAGRSMEARQARDRRAPLDAANLKAADQQFRSNELAYGEKKRVLDQQAEVRRFMQNQDPLGEAPLGGVGPLAPVPKTKSELMGEVSQFQMGQGDLEGASTTVDRTEKIRGTEAEAKARAFMDAYRKGGIPGAIKALPPGSNPQEVMSNVSFDPAGNGYTTKLDDGSSMVTTFGANGNISVKHVTRTPKVPDQYGVERTITLNGKDVKQQYNRTTGRWETSAQGTGVGGVGGTGGVTNTLTPDARHDLAVIGIVNPNDGRLKGRKALNENIGIQNERAQLRRDIGMDEGDTVTRKAEFKSLAGALYAQQKNLASVEPFINNIAGQTERWKELSKGLNTADIRLFNVPWRAARSKIMGSALQQEMDTLIAEISTELAKVANGSTGSVQAAAEGARKQWDEIHDKNLSIEDMGKLLDGFGNIAGIRLSTIREQMDSIKREMGSLVVKPGQGKVADVTIGGRYKGRIVTNKGKDEEGRLWVMYSDGTEVEVK